MRAPTAAAPKRSAPYRLTLPDWTGWRASPVPSVRTGAVDDAVDDALVEEVVGGVGDDDRTLADPVDDAVDHVLVDPVHEGAMGPATAPMTPFS